MGSVGAHKNNTNYLEQFRHNGTNVLDNELAGMNPVLVNKTLNGVADTLKEFGLDLSTVTAIGHAWQSNEVAGVNGFNQLSLSDDYKLPQNDFNSSNMQAFTQAGWVIDPSAYGTGTHEAGHIISNVVLRRVYAAENKTQAQISADRHSGKWDLRIAREAKNVLGTKLSPISQYGGSLKGQKSVEYVAEAVSDYMVNRDKANKSSLAVVQVLKKYLSQYK